MDEFQSMQQTRDAVRKHPRFALRYPVHLTFGGPGALQQLDALSENISVSGILLDTTLPVPQNCGVKFVMTIQRSKKQRPMRLKGSGRVVRVEQHPSGERFGVAIQCTRPIYRMLSALRSTGA